MYISKYTTLTASAMFKKLNTDESGLSSTEARKRLTQYGPNIINGKELKWWHVLARQFKSPFMYLLLLAALLAFLLGEKIDAIMILVFIAINTILGFCQEYQSEKSLRLLKKLIVARARVHRNKKDDLIDASLLVPGDLVMIETGDIVPADIRLVQTDSITVDESALTGESAPVIKHDKPLTVEAPEITAAENIVFSGTTIASGKGIGLVVTTGQNTAMGGVAKLTVETNRESTFEKGIAKFSSFILKMILVILVFVFIANVYLKGGEANLAELTLFSIALAVSVIPEALPLVTTLSLSRGALRLARKKVTVKRLSAVEDLGSIEVLCTDKTGTITKNHLSVKEVKANNQAQCLFDATLASSFLAEKKAEPNNSFDLALWKKLTPEAQNKIKQSSRLHELPFDPVRKRNDVVIRDDSGVTLIVRGALEEILPLCANLKQDERDDLVRWSQKAGENGQRVLAVAKKILIEQTNNILEQENNLTLSGLIAFIDPIKPSTKDAIKQARELGVKVKIITGDAKEVAGAIAAKIGLITNHTDVITGTEIENLNGPKRLETVEKYQVFARVSPQQKFLIIETLQKKYEVGFLGEGINDAPALKLANVAIVVDGASDIAREAADIVLLNSNLSVIVDGIKNGREIFSNTIKYLKITLISNFGNFYAIAIASLIITFLPMLPIQILLLNLLSDFPMIAIATDNVDTIELRRPRSYNVKEVITMAIFLGIISTVFDFIFFALFFRGDPAVLQTSWFIGSVLTELILIYSIRTHFFCLSTKKPSGPLLWLSLVAIATTIIVPFTSLGATLFHFQAPTLHNLLIIFGVVVCYFIITEIVKTMYYRITDRTIRTRA